MIDALRSEWIKMRTIRMNYVLVIIAIAFPLVITLLTVALQNVDDINSENVVALVTGTSVITGMLLGVVGATGITGEFTHGTIRPTFAATPRRGIVIAAKAIVTVVIAAVVEAAVVVVTYSLAAAIAGSRDAPISLSPDDASVTDLRPALLGVVAFACIVALLGYGLGLLIRNAQAAIAILILWPLVAEGLIGALLAAVGVDRPFRYLPYNSGFQLANPGRVDSDTLGRVPGGLYFLAVTVAIGLLGSLAVSKRDA